MFFEEPGWIRTPAAGMLALTLADFPEMTYADVLNWAAANGLPRWRPTLDRLDTAAVADDGIMRWDEQFGSPPNWAVNYKAWKAGQQVAILPLEPVTPQQQIETMTAVANAATQVAAVAPALPSQPSPTPTPAAPDPLDVVTAEAIAVAPATYVTETASLTPPPPTPAAPAPSVVPSWLPTSQIAQAATQTAQQAATQVALADTVKKIGLAAALYYLIF